MYRCFYTLLFVMTTLFSFSVVYAAGPTTTEKTKMNDFDNLTHLLAAFSTYQADFEQFTYDDSGFELQKLTGKIKLQKPNRFYWQSDEPYAQVLVSNGKIIWHYDQDLEQLVVQQYSEQKQQVPMLVILEDAAKLAQSFKWVKTTTGNSEEKGEKRDEDSTVLFQLQSLDKNSPVTSIEFGFNNKQLSSMSFIDSMQQKTTIRFTKLQIDQAIAASTFEFIIPENVDVLYE